jgi:RNA polymerase sigma-70 factor (ECF subfamily)
MRAERVLLQGTKFTKELLERLYEKHGAALAAYGCCYGLDFAAAEDVVQQVFLKLMEGKVVAAHSPVAYLYRAARNASFNHKRNRRREVELPEGELWFSHATADRAEVLSLQNALRKMPEEQREAVFLRMWSGMTLQEIAEATDTPLNTVASRYRYALEKLRGQLWEQPGKVRNAEK